MSDFKDITNEEVSKFDVPVFQRMPYSHRAASSSNSTFFFAKDGDYKSVIICITNC